MSTDDPRPGDDGARPAAPDADGAPADPRPAAGARRAPGGPRIAPPGAARAIGLLAAREVRGRLREKVLLGTTAVLLLLVTAATVLPALLAQSVPTYRVAVQGEAADAVVRLAAELGREVADGGDVPPLASLLEPAGLPAAEVELVTLDDETDVERIVRQQDVVVAVVGDRVGELVVLGREGVPADLEVLLGSAASQLQVRETAQDAGLTDEQVDALADPRVPPEVVLLDPRAPGGIPPEALVVGLAVLFYVSVLTVGMGIAQGVAEEKHTRAVDVLAAAVPVRWLLVGRVLGSTVVAVAQVVLVVGAGLLGAALTGQDELLHQVLEAAWWFGLFFVIGFVMLACLWAAAGALAAREEDLNATTVVMQVLVVLPFFAAVLATDPGPVQRVLAYVPFTAPLLMPARIVLGTAQPWEPWVAAGVLLIGAVVLVLVGARIHDNALLRTERLRARDAWRGTA
ncbi:ABC transporter permease [Cellulomonas carbonis]|nr:ABC transporter permease [Cellulomonas carbonis]GGC03404.1 ABC transporter permease [Cellulomonas carbonis]